MRNQEELGASMMVTSLIWTTLKRDRISCPNHTHSSAHSWRPPRIISTTLPSSFKRWFLCSASESLLPWLPFRCTQWHDGCIMFFFFFSPAGVVCGPHYSRVGREHSEQHSHTSLHANEKLGLTEGVFTLNHIGQQRASEPDSPFDFTVSSVAPHTVTSSLLIVTFLQTHSRHNLITVKNLSATPSFCSAFFFFFYIWVICIYI